VPHQRLQPVTPTVYTLNKSRYTHIAPNAATPFPRLGAAHHDPLDGRSVCVAAGGGMDRSIEPIVAGSSSPRRSRQRRTSDPDRRGGVWPQHTSTQASPWGRTKRTNSSSVLAAPVVPLMQTAQTLGPTMGWCDPALCIARWCQLLGCLEACDAHFRRRIAPRVCLGLR